MPARIGLGLAGHALPTRALLEFQLDHARARDAVHQDLARPFPLPHLELHSAAANRAEYLRRPDLGRRLSDASAGRIEPGSYDAAFVICDGLSPTAITRHAAPLLAEVEPRLAGWKLAPLTVVLQGRVAVGDEVATRLGARLAVVLIGERPGLTSFDSLGIYLTWNPKQGITTDAERNCISNIRAEGLSYSLAAHKLHYLMEEARRRELSGVPLKEDADTLEGSMSPLILFAMLASDVPPRLIEGNATSPVKVVIFEDLQCGDCADFRVMLDKQLLPKYAGKVSFEHRDFPLPKHNWARKAAIASRNFQRMSGDALAVKYRRETMAAQKEITAQNFNEKLAAFAKKNGLDPAQAMASLNDSILEAEIDKDYKDGVARGVGRTPTVLVDGEPFIERFTYEEIAAALDKAVKDIK